MFQEGTERKVDIMAVYVDISIWYFPGEQEYLNFGYFSMGAGELYHAYHRISVKEAERELHRLEEKLGRKATEKIAEDGVKYVNLRGFFME